MTNKGLSQKCVRPQNIIYSSPERNHFQRMDINVFPVQPNNVKLCDDFSALRSAAISNSSATDQQQNGRVNESVIPRKDFSFFFRENVPRTENMT